MSQGLLSRVGDEVAKALSAATDGRVDDPDPLLRRSEFADLQANFALALGRRLGQAPRDLAQATAGHLAGSPLLATVEVSGPGFLNLSFADAAVIGAVGELLVGERCGVATVPAPETVVVDYSAPNVAKEMHVGHLRSTIIGDTLVRVLGFLGHSVIRRNHIGDWGTPFGMLIAYLLAGGSDADPGDGVEAEFEIDGRVVRTSVGDLTRFYQSARERFDADEAFREESRRWVVRLQQGDPQARQLWQHLVRVSTSYFSAVYDRLDVLLDDGDLCGESSYNDALDDVVVELEAKGLLRVDDGALCAFPDGFTNREGQPLPLIVRKADGGYGYAATDLAAVRDRTGNLGATRLLYVVGAPQSQHLEMVFAVSRSAGWLREGARAEHVAFGSVLGEDGKMLRTRAGQPVRLIELLDEAVRRAGEEVAERNADLAEADRAAIAHAVGIGGVKYADLVNDRRGDYRFDIDRMLKPVGNTGPYLQYARARIASILERTAAEGVDVDEPVTADAFAHPAERVLAMELLHFEEVLHEVSATLEPHHLCRQLFAVASTFSSFYEQCRVKDAPAHERPLRLALCRATERVLATGLDLLGMQAPARI